MEKDLHQGHIQLSVTTTVTTETAADILPTTFPEAAGAALGAFLAGVFTGKITKTEKSKAEDEKLREGRKLAVYSSSLSWNINRA